MEKQTVSVKDIAREAGTSVATVSRVINQNGRFSKETEKRVWAVIKKYNYETNQLARSLRVKRSTNIGILVPDITNEFFSGITWTVQRELMKHGYMTVICNSGEDRDLVQKQVRMLLGQKVSGIIYIGGAAITDKLNIPTIYVDRDPRNTTPDLENDFELIECDNIQGGYLAGKELTEKGCRRAAYVCFNEALSTIRKRRQGFEKALEEAGAKFLPENGVSVESVTLREGWLATEKILRRHPDTDGIFYMSDVLAIGGLKYLRQRGISIPEKVKLVGFDDISLSEIIEPGLTTIHQPLEEMGNLAVERLLSFMNDGEIAFQHERLPVYLVRRGTT